MNRFLNVGFSLPRQIMAYVGSHSQDISHSSNKSFGKLVDPADPLRKPKLDLYSILAGKMEPISAKKLLEEYRLSSQDEFDSKIYGFDDIHKFLEAFPELYGCRRGFVPEDSKYWSKVSTNAATCSIQEIIKKQRLPYAKDYPIPGINAFEAPPPCLEPILDEHMLIGEMKSPAIPKQFADSSSEPVFDFGVRKRLRAHGVAFGVPNDELSKKFGELSVGVNQSTNLASHGTGLSPFKGFSKRQANQSKASMLANNRSPHDQDYAVPSSGPLLPEERSRISRSLHPKEIDALLNAVRENGIPSEGGIKLSIQDSLRHAEEALGGSIGGNANPITHKQLITSLKDCSPRYKQHYSIMTSRENQWILLTKTTENKTEGDGLSTNNSPYKFTSGAKRALSTYLQRNINQNKKDVVNASTKPSETSGKRMLFPPLLMNIDFDEVENTTVVDGMLDLHVSEREEMIDDLSLSGIQNPIEDVKDSNLPIIMKNSNKDTISSSLPNITMQKAGVDHNAINTAEEDVVQKANEDGHPILPDTQETNEEFVSPLDEPIWSDESTEEITNESYGSFANDGNISSEWTDTTKQAPNSTYTRADLLKYSDIKELPEEFFGILIRMGMHKMCLPKKIGDSRIAPTFPEVYRSNIMLGIDNRRRENTPESASFMENVLRFADLFARLTKQTSQKKLWYSVIRLNESSLNEDGDKMVKKFLKME